ncbi:MAG: glycosyltransferase family 2 protein [Candidatus Eremiobacteraeota bacterium]|nr:glycosyltransferase family 2 protein [Candidatus Eremiobacteraeota bacterium]
MSLVTVMVPCFNAAPFLPQCLQSIREQTHNTVEMVVVDDGSTDRSLEVLARCAPEATVVRKSHQGIARSLNAALEHARGDFFAWVDADDLWLPTKLERQLSLLQSQPDLDGCFGGLAEFREDSSRSERPPGKGLHRGSLLIRKESFFQVGPFREDIDIGEFIDWYSRARDTGCRFGDIPETLYLRRIHSSSTMQRSPADMRDYLKVAKASLDRRRRKG